MEVDTMKTTKVTRYDRDMVNFDIIDGNQLLTHIILAKNGEYYSSGFVPVKIDEEGKPVFDENGNFVLEDYLWEMAKFIWSHFTE